MMLSATLTGAISMALITMLKATPLAEARIAESKDITFLQTWIPVDLATAINSYPHHDDATVKAEMAANDPFVTYSATLDGTNVLTLVVPNANTGALEVVVYRYAEIRGSYLLVRYRISDPGTASEQVSVVGVAHEVPPPPDGWVAGDPVPHVARVVARNQSAVRPVGEDVTITFESGNEFRTGGAGLSAQRDLTPNDPVTLPDPTAPPSRCGGRIAVVIDTSGSVPIGFGGVPTEKAAVGFIDAFVGTPTQISINGFDRGAYGMIDDPARAKRYVAKNERAPFLSVLDNGPQVTAMRNRITALDDRDGNWSSSNVDSPTKDGIHWDQIGSGTNWEDGLWNVFFDNAGQPHNSFQPDLVVFITDGQPTYVRAGDGSPTTAAEVAAKNAAAQVANAGRSQGARIIGVMVGNQAGNPKYVGYLKDVVGGEEWDGSVAADGTVDVGNAVAADFFTGSFSQLGGVLRSIMIAECGGTVTVRKGIDDGSTASGRWNYSTEVGDQILDADVTNSITFDFGFSSGVTTREVIVREEVRDGYTFVRADCSSRGQLITDTSKVKPLGSGTPGVAIQLRPDEAISCVMVSEPS